MRCSCTKAPPVTSFLWRFSDVFLISGKLLPTLDDNRITLQCLENYMLLKMDLQDLPIIEPTSLHLRHFSCRPQVINTSALFRVPFRGCGTTLGIELDHIVYQNVVDNSQKMNGSRMAVRHAPELYYPFVCRYRQKYIVTLKEGRGTDQNSKTGRENRNQTTEGNVFILKLRWSLEILVKFRLDL